MNRVLFIHTVRRHGGTTDMHIYEHETHRNTSQRTSQRNCGIAHTRVSDILITWFILAARTCSLDGKPHHTGNFHKLNKLIYIVGKLYTKLYWLQGTTCSPYDTTVDEILQAGRALAIEGAALAAC